MRIHVMPWDDYLIHSCMLKFDKPKYHHTSSVIARQSLVLHTPAIISSSSLVKTLPVGF